MSEEPRRKRKWDNQGEDGPEIKKVASDIDAQSAQENDGTRAIASTGGQNGSSAQSAADAAAAAAAIAAARINAMLVAQGKAPTDTEVSTSHHTKTAESRSEAGGDPAGSGHGHGHSSVPIRESRERDEFVADIDINDVKHRYVLTKGSVQVDLRETGADVTTRGQYYADRSMATEKLPPLYLHVTAQTQEILDRAIKKINELIEEAQAPAPLPPQRESFQPGSRGFGGPPRHQSFHARVAIGIESDRMFNVRAKIVGPGGQYVKHVQNETKTRVQLKGHGSGYLEVDTGRESDEPLFINILGNAQEDVDEAERLCKDLVETVRAEYERMKSRPPMQQEPYGHNRHYGGRSQGNYNGGHNQRYQGGHHYQQQQQPHHQYGYNQHYQAPPPPPPGTTAPPVNPPLPPGPPPPPSSATHSTSAAPVAASATGASTGEDVGAVAADPNMQGYTYEQYEAYNQYYYQQQYHQQYGQYYQQAYTQPGAEQGAAGASAPGALVSSDPALAYYGYAYAPPPPPLTAEGEAGAPGAASESETGAAAPPPPPPPASTTDSQ